MLRPFVRLVLGLTFLAAPFAPGLAHAAAPRRPIGHGGVTAPADAAGGAPAELLLRRAAAKSAPREVDGVALYPRYSWPLDDANQDSVRAQGYPDEDPTAGIRDYRNGGWTYDGHGGTDIILADFRAMDRGRRVVAAAPGTVTFASFANPFDRICDSVHDPNGNYLEVANGDGTYTYYFHLRANSMTVNVGESVQRGEVLGLAGSSGNSGYPHLHFEPADFTGGYHFRDPWAGPANPNPGLWDAQEPYAGATPLRVYDFGVTTQTASGGDLSTLWQRFCTHVAEKLEQPVVFGQHEPYFAVWLFPQGSTGQSYRIEIRKPDQSLWGDVDFALPEDFPGIYHYWYWNWDPWITPADFGTWSVKIFVGGWLQRQTSFVVGATTSFGPRFRGGVGRSFRIDGTVQRDTLRVTGLGAGPITYALLNAPAFVTLTDSILTIPASSTQTTRSRWFQAIAQDGAARRDTAFFHVVDPSKPREPVTVDAPVPVPSGLALAPVGPNPFAGATTLELALPRSAVASLAIVDLAGRRVRTLVPARWIEAGPYRVIWDGRDEHGAVVPAGVYFARLEAAGEHVARRLVRLP